MRGDLKEPLGPIFEDMHSLLEHIDGALITVGDVVSYHAEEADHSPDVAVIDGRTKRSAVDPEIEDTLAEQNRHRVSASNPAGTITRSLLDGLRTALDESRPTQLVVDGEEDLAALPAILAAPDGSHVLYGQPDEGIVHVRVDAAARNRVKELLGGMDGDTEHVIAALTD